MRRRIAFMIVAALAAPTVGSPSAMAMAASGGPCAGRSGLVWEHISGDDVVELMSMGCDGVLHQLTRTPPGQGGSEAPRWGRHDTVYFDSDRAGQIHVFRMKAAEGAPAAQLSADGTDDGLFVIPDRPGVGESSFRRLTTTPNAATGGIDTSPDVSPDGRTVAFVRFLDPTFGSALSAVFTVQMDGTHVRQLTPFTLNAAIGSFTRMSNLGCPVSSC